MQLLSKPALALAGFLLLSCMRPVFADDARKCVELGATPQAQSIRNICEVPVFVFWCHDSADKTYRDGRCDAGTKFYKKQWVFKPGQTDSNPYSEPPGSTLTFGACAGGYASRVLTDDKGAYRCKPTKTEATGKSPVTMTASAATAEEACKRAWALADGNSAPGECSCQVRANLSVCKAQSAAAQPDASSADIARRKIREQAGCKPNETNCKPARPRDGEFGARG